MAAKKEKDQQRYEVLYREYQRFSGHVRVTVHIRDKKSKSVLCQMDKTGERITHLANMSATVRQWTLKLQTFLRRGRLRDLPKLLRSDAWATHRAKMLNVLRDRYQWQGDVTKLCLSASGWDGLDYVDVYVTNVPIPHKVWEACVFCSISLE